MKHKLKKFTAVNKVTDSGVSRQPPPITPYQTLGLVTTDIEVTKNNAIATWADNQQITGSSLKLADNVISHVDDDGVLVVETMLANGITHQMQDPVPIDAGKVVLDVSLYNAFRIVKDQDIEIKIIQSIIPPTIVGSFPHVSFLIYVETTVFSTQLSYNTTAEDALPISFPDGRSPTLRYDHVGNVTRLIGSVYPDIVLLSTGGNAFAIPLPFQNRGG